MHLIARTAAAAAAASAPMRISIELQKDKSGNSERKKRFFPHTVLYTQSHTRNIAKESERERERAYAGGLTFPGRRKKEDKVLVGNRKGGVKITAGP